MNAYFDFDFLTAQVKALTQGVPHLIANLSNISALLWQALVPNVHDFPGHIACDSASNAEIVVPLWKNGEVWGVLDIDSPTVGRFTEADQDGLEQVAKVIEEVLQNNGITY